MSNKVLDIEQIAKVCHEANRAYCQTIGDYSHSQWEWTPTDIQQSAIAGVRAKISNPNLSPQEQHEMWMKHKQEQGYVYGPKKDLDKLTHPCLVPYEQLPEKDKKKDFIFGKIVLAFLECP